MPIQLDKIGMATSTACAIHCAAVPALLGVLPILGLGFVAASWFEWSMVGVAAIVGCFAMIRGHRAHRRHTPSCFFLSGLGIVLTALLVFGCNCHPPMRQVFDINAGAMVMIPIPSPHRFPWKAVVMAIGGLMIAASHFVNDRLCRSCASCSGHGD